MTPPQESSEGSAASHRKSVLTTYRFTCTIDHVNPRSYREVKEAILNALETGNYRHEARAGSAYEKKLLQVGEVTETFVADAIRVTPARSATRSDHHFLAGVHVWTITPTLDDGSGVVRGWYIKFYCLAENNVWFISVHPA